jgi:hypothetical protein
MTFATRMAGGTAIGAAMRIGVSASPVQAGYIVDLMEKGGNVVATGSGNIDLTGLTLNGESTGQFALWPAGAHIAIGPTTLAANHLYISITGPTSFETGGAGFASSGTGDSVGILVDPSIYLYQRPRWLTHGVFPNGAQDDSRRHGGEPCLQR